METKVGLAIAMITVGNTGPLRSASLVQMSLWDKGASAEMPTGLAHAAPGVDVSKGNDGIELRPARLRVGNVPFNVKAIPRIPFTRSLPTRASYFLALMPGAGSTKTRLATKARFRSSILANQVR